MWPLSIFVNALISTPLGAQPAGFAPVSLSWEDLSDPSTFLVFLTYERPGFKCPSCEHFEETIEQLGMPVKRLNFAEDVRLGSRFLQYSFPSFIVRSELRSYLIEPKNSAELLELVKQEEWRNRRPVRPMMDVNSWVARCCSDVNPMIFFVLRKLYFVVDRVPEKLVAFAIIFVIVYLIYSIVEVFTEPDDPKAKKE